MITESIISVFTMIFRPLINLIPNLDTLQIPENIMRYLMSIFQTIGIFVPLKEILPILIFIIGLTCWRMILAVINRIRFLI